MRRFVLISLWILAVGGGAFAQDGSGAIAQQDPAEPIDKRVFGVLPNYRTADGTLPFQSITPAQKMKIAAKDSFDWPLYLLGGAYAGIAQLADQNAYLGQGMKGYGQRFWRNYTDQAMGNIMTEGVMSSLLREDPRYFRRGQSGGSFGHRFGYAASRIFVTRTDSGGKRINLSELLGNAGAVAFSNVYYTDTRTAQDNVQKFAVQLATDAVSNVLKEFWPDVKKRLFKPKE